MERTLNSGLLRKGLLALALAAGGTAGAQGFSLNAAATLGGLTFAGAGVNVGLTAQNLFTLGSVPIDGRISADIKGGGVLVNVDALAAYDAGGFLLYGGPGLNIGGPGIGLALTGGLNYPLTDRLGLYGEASLRLLNSAGSVFRFGLSYDL